MQPTHPIHRPAAELLEARYQQRNLVVLIDLNTCHAQGLLRLLVPGRRLIRRWVAEGRAFALHMAVNMPHEIPLASQRGYPYDLLPSLPMPVYVELQ